MAETTFGGRKFSEKELEDLILIALAKREQMVADEKLNPLRTPRNSLAFTGKVNGSRGVRLPRLVQDWQQKTT
jgi:hypothetical protein